LVNSINVWSNPNPPFLKLFLLPASCENQKTLSPLPIKGALSLAYTPLLIPPPAQELKKAQPPGRTFSFIIIYCPLASRHRLAAVLPHWMFDVGRWMLDVF